MRYIAWVSVFAFTYFNTQLAAQSVDKGELNKSLQELEQAEQQYGEGHFGTVSALQSVASDYAMAGDDRCRVYLQRIKSILDSVEYDPSWYFRPTQIEMFLEYQQENHDAARALARRVHNLVLGANFYDDKKAEFITETMQYSVEFADPQGIEAGAEALQQLLSSASTLDNEQRETIGENIKRAKHNAGAIRSLMELMQKGAAPYQPPPELPTNNTADQMYATQDGYNVLADFEKNEEQFYREASSGNQNAVGFLMNVGTVYSMAGDLAKAERVYSKANQLLSRNPQSNREDLHLVRMELCKTYQEIGNWEKAREIAEQLSEEMSERGEKDGDAYTKVQLSLALIYAGSGELEKFKQTAGFLKEKLMSSQGGPQFDRDLNRSFLGFAAVTAGDNDLAEELILAALPGLRDASENPTAPEAFIQSAAAFSACDMSRLLLLRLYLNSGRMAEAGKILDELQPATEKRYLDTSHFVRSLLAGAVHVHLWKKEPSEAEAQLDKLVAAQNKNLRNVMELPEDDLLSWQAEFHDLSPAAAVYSDGKLADFVLQRKGLVTDALIERQRVAKKTGELGLGDELEELNRVSSALVDKQSQRNAMEEHAAAIKELQDKKAEISRKIAMKANIERKADEYVAITADDVARSLPADSSLVEMFTYRPWTGERFGDEHHGAFIITPGKENVKVDFGRRADIDKAIGSFRTSLLSGDSGSCLKSLSQVKQLLWDPIERSLPPTTKNVVISPEGQINFVPFAALPDDDGRFVAEKYNIAHVSAGRDLLRPSRAGGSDRVVVVSNPDFQLGQPGENSADGKRSRALQLAPLPGTAEEADKISAIVSRADKDVVSLSGGNAKEGKLAELKGPGVLHFATHGFYLNAPSQPPSGARGMKVAALVPAGQEIGAGKMLNPMLASGIALAGAQDTLNAWAVGGPRISQEDGVLTAAEVAQLSLEGTKLVTLSACETGQGESRDGEGVFGLRRAFLMAGSQNLLMTLWPVSDATTPFVMEDFYADFMSGHSAVESFANAQRKWLVKLREEQGIFAAVRDAGPFAMVKMANAKETPASR